VTAVAVLGFVIAGLGLICGGIMLLTGGVFAAGGAIADEAAQKAGLSKTGASAIGGLLIVYALLTLVTAIMAIPASIGLLQRRKWGRTLTLVTCGLAIVDGLASIIGGLLGILFLALLLTYAIMGFVQLLKPQVAAEFR
jgi:hypothetical protein